MKTIHIALVKYWVGLSPEKRSYATIVCWFVITLLTVRHYEIKDIKRQVRSDEKNEQLRHEKNLEVNALNAKLEVCNDRMMKYLEKYEQLNFETQLIKNQIKDESINK